MHQRVVPKKLTGRTLGDHASGVENDGSRADFGDECEVVGREESGGDEIAENADELATSARIESARRLIEDEGPWPAREQPRQANSLLLPAAEPVGQPPIESGKPHLRERVLDARAERPCAKPKLPGPERDVLTDRRAKELIVRILEQEAHLAASFVHRLVAKPFAEDEHFPLAVAFPGLGENADYMQEKGGLAGAVRADEPHALPLRHVQRNVAQGRRSVFEVKRQVAEVDGIRHGAPPRARIAT
jgi:hypothetical protein